MRKDKQGWLDNFSEDAVFQDPVGVSLLDETGDGHKGKQAIEEFWDKNIASSSLVFNIQHSYAPNGSNECCNVGQIITRVEQSKVTTITNGCFIYKVNDSGKVVSLRAFYDFNQMLKSSVRFPKTKL